MYIMYIDINIFNNVYSFHHIYTYIYALNDSLCLNRYLTFKVMPGVFQILAYTHTHSRITSSVYMHTSLNKYIHFNHTLGLSILTNTSMSIHLHMAVGQGTNDQTSRTVLMFIPMLVGYNLVPFKSHLHISNFQTYHP